MTPIPESKLRLALPQASRAFLLANRLLASAFPDPPKKGKNGHTLPDPITHESFQRPDSTPPAVQVSAHPGTLPGAPGLVAAGTQDPEPEPHPGAALVAAAPPEGGGAAGLAGRVVCHFTLFRVRLLDPDNAHASVKYLLDALRYSQLIPNDRERDIVLIVDQQKVASGKLEGTGIALTFP